MADPRLDAYANWLVQNKDKQGTPEFETVATAYKGLRGSTAPKPDPYANKSLADIQKMYGQAPDRRAKEAVSDAYVRKEAKEGGFGLALDDVIRQGAKGVPIVGGLLDEGNAALSSAFGGDYGEALDYNRARDRYRESVNPESSLAVQVAGGVAGTIAGARAIGVPAAAAGPAAPLYQQAARTAAIAAPIGAADFFARGEGGFENRAENAAAGAGFGAALGVAAPYLSAGVGSVYQRARDLLTSDAMLRRMGLSREAGQELLSALQGDDTLTGTGLARIRAGGPNAMLADAGPNASSALDTAMNTGGASARIGREAVEGRATQSANDLTQTLDQTLGPRVGVQERITATRQGTAGARGRAYDAAYNDPIDYNTPAGQEIARLWARVRPNRRAQANALLEEAGLPPIADDALPNVRQLDYVTRALNDVAQSAEGQGALGGINQVGMSAQNLAQGLRQAARTAVPNYARALDTAADPIQRIAATRLGQRLLNPNFTRDELAQEIRGISAAERRAALGGVRDAIDDMSAKVTQMASDPNIDARELRAALQALTSRSSREKMQMILGNANSTRALYGQIGRAMRSLELRAQVATNSRTAARTEAMRRARERADGGVVGAAQRGKLVEAARKAFQFLTGSTDAAQLAREQRMFEQITRALTGPRGRDAEQYLRNLVRAATARARSGAQSRRVGQAAGVVPFGAAQGQAGDALGEFNQP